MGKNKAQRTKNNAKPSSSGRSAELLGTAIPKFVGFSAVKDGGYVPILPGLGLSTLEDCGIGCFLDTNFQLVFKKMTKKDSTTKFKALHEFGELCEKSPMATVGMVVSLWPKLYSTLAIDNEHRVREAAQLAHAALLNKVGKKTAPYLKQLAGPWFTSQFDTYPPASSAATNSFIDTFSQKKIVDVIVHCQEEILSYINDNIIVQTAQSLSASTSNNVNSEEIEAKYQRVIVCSLQGYARYLQLVPPQQIEKTRLIHENIIGNNKFWKLAKHESSQIKMAFFNVLASMINHAKELLHPEKKRTITAIMNSLDENEPGIVAAVWECMVTAIDKMEDWYLAVSVEKFVLPKLWRVLRSGGSGSASIIYPNLLPFLSQFPKFNVEDKGSLFTNFFNNICQGFSIKSVQISRLEMIAISKSFIECLRYAILLNNSQVDLCEALLREQLMPVIELAIKENSSVKIILFNEVAQLIRYWSKNRNSTEFKCYSQLVSIFWSELSSMFDRLNNDTTQIFDKLVLSNIYDAQIKLLLSLKNTPEVTKKNVTFADTEPAENQHLPKLSIVDEDQKYFEELEQFVTKLCITYFENLQELNTSYKIEHLNQLISKFDSQTLFLTIARAHTNKEDLLEFYNSTLKHWLLQENSDINSAVEFIFVLLKYMDSEGKTAVLESLIELKDKRVLNSAIMCALSENYMKDTVVKFWRRGSHITEYLMEITNTIVAGESKELDTKLVEMAFETRDGDFNISEEAINTVATKLCDTLATNLENPSEIITELLSRLIEFTWNYEKFINASLTMQRTLFNLIIHDSLSPELREIIYDKCKTGFMMICKKLSNNQLFEIQTEFMKMIYDKIYTLDSTVDEIVDIAQSFVEASNNYDNEGALSLMIHFNLSNECELHEWISCVNNVVLHAELLTGNFYSVNPVRSLSLDQPLALMVAGAEKLPNRTLECLHWALFNAKLLNKLLRQLDDDDKNDEVDSSVKDCLSDLPHILNSILLVTSLGSLYSQHYKLTENHDLITKNHRLLEAECSQLKELVPKYIWNKIINETLDITSHWIEFGSIFSEFLRYFYGSKQHLLEVKAVGEEILKKYLENNETELEHHLNAVVLARNLLENDRYYPRCSEVLVRIIKRHESDRDFLLFNRDLGPVAWADYYFVLEVIRLFTKFVVTAPYKMSPGMWDATIIFLASWQLSLKKSKHRWDDLKIQYMVAAVSELYCAMQDLMCKQQVEPESQLPLKLVDEWKNVFADDVNREMANLWIKYVELFSDKTNYVTPTAVIAYLGRAMQLLDGNTFFQSYSGYTSVNITADQVLKCSLKALSSSTPSIQVTAYHALNRLIPKLVEQDKDLIAKDNFDAKVLNIRKFEQTLLDMQKLMNTMLGDFKLCDADQEVILPFSECYSIVFSYFLAWATVLDMCAHAHADLRFQYGEMLKEELFISLMNNVCRLIPTEMLQDSKLRTPSPNLMEIFKKPTLLNFDESIAEWRLDRMACWIYVNCLRHLPVLARQWWSTTDSRVSNIVDKLTTFYVSPILCQEELSNRKFKDVENLQINVHSTAREIVALYQMDDTKLELNMVMPVNHPLGLVTVEPGRYAGGAANWRNSHMQLSIFLTHQNGSIWDGLMMWKNNLDKKFSGVEECYICFSIFHINTYQIPKLSCHTCRKKFHAPCLYKWFSTSQKSTCPICRNIF